MKDEKSLKDDKPEPKAKETDENDTSSFILPPSSLLFVSVIMGSKSDWEMMQRADEVIERFDVPHECLVVSAHRTPLWMAEFAAGGGGGGGGRGIWGGGGGGHPAGGGA